MPLALTIYRYKAQQLKSAGAPIDGAPMTLVGSEVAIDEYDKWKDLFASIFTGGTR